METIAKLPPITTTDLENAVIYEANIRQYSKEGTFEAFSKDIPVLKELGVKILWLMPIYPISATRSKGKLGSYYAISDYGKVNPEFGDLEDFRKLVQTAHQNGIYVILDWVANHTGWDHQWLIEHPEFYTKDESGNIVHTPGTDWTDVADLNFENTKLREKMRQHMLYWLKEENIDGFRCDMAAMVPKDFWENTIKDLKKVKPVFMLAEAWEPDLMVNAFDMAYGWDTHHRMNDIARGDKNGSAFDDRMRTIDGMYSAGQFLMNFTSNHDENSWNGSVFERMGPAAPTFAALSYCIPGMPLIYSGQEYDLKKRLLFFDKDSIAKEKGIFFDLYKKLGYLKNNNKALYGGKNAAAYNRLHNSNGENVFIFQRIKEDEEIVFIANLSKAKQNSSVAYQGDFIDYISGESLSLKPDASIELEPWQYHILVSKKFYEKINSDIL